VWESRESIIVVVWVWGLKLNPNYLGRKEAIIATIDN